MESNELKCSKCGTVLKEGSKFCSNCGQQIVNNQLTDKVYISSSKYDPIFSLPEDKMVEAFIKKKLEKIGLDTTRSSYIPQELVKKKMILNTIFSILLFIFISLIFFHFPFITYCIALIIILYFRKFTKKFDIIKYLAKQLKERPSEKVSNILMNAKKNLVKDNTKILKITTNLLAIILPLVLFINPRIFYEKTNGGLGVRFYTFGLTNFTTAKIPSSYKNKKVVSLRGNTFSNMFFLTDVSLPNTLKEIRGQAFFNDYNLRQVTLPNQLEYLGGGAFSNCFNLEYIEIPDTVTYMGGDTFYNASSLKSIKLSDNLSEIRGNTFESCTSLESIIIPDNVTRIGGHAFYGCSSLTSVNFSEASKLKEIGSSAFRKCDNLYTVTIPSNVNVNERAFKESPTIVNHFYEYNDDYSS